MVLKFIIFANIQSNEFNYCFQSHEIGRPQPVVSWFLNGQPIDEEYEQNSGNIIENRLLWPSIQRHDLYSIFTCRAFNTKAIAPREKRLVLDMYRKCFSPYVSY